MTLIPDLPGLPGPQPSLTLAAAVRHASETIARILESGPVPPPEPAHAEAGTAYLGQLLFTLQLADGADPRAAAVLLSGAGRGEDLARQFLAAGTVQVCCDYCGSLMLLALAGAVADQMTRLHGPAAAAAWRQLEDAILPAGPADAGDLPPLGLARPYLPQP